MTDAVDHPQARGTFTRDRFAEQDDVAGVFIDGLGLALVTWTAMQDHIPAVKEAAMAFNTTEDVIREAVESAMWIFVSGDKLELDGE